MVDFVGVVCNCAFVFGFCLGVFGWVLDFACYLVAFWVGTG